MLAEFPRAFSGARRRASRPSCRRRNALAATAIAVLLADGGHYVKTLPSFPAVILNPLLNGFRRIKRHTLKLNPSVDDLSTLLQWVSDGRLRQLISERFAFGDAANALKRSKTGHARGKLVVRVA